jgi:hypothetical protein
MDVDGRPSLPYRRGRVRLALQGSEEAIELVGRTIREAEPGGQ